MFQYLNDIRLYFSIASVLVGVAFESRPNCISTIAGRSNCLDALTQAYKLIVNAKDIEAIGIS
jgi:hypothetical protein